MKTSFKHSLSFLTISIFIFLAIASVASKKNMTIEKGEIPPDFKGYNETLVIVKQSKDWDKYAEKYFTENYKGKFIMIDEAELSKYADTDKYRFVLGRNLGVTQDAGSSYSYVSDESLCVIDRKTGKKYSTKAASTYGKLLEYYSAALEEARQ